jgi:FkbM family methyltransferase
MPGYPRYALLILPLTRREVPGWSALFRWFEIGGEDEGLWKEAPTRTIRGKFHGYKMPLRLSNWSERMTYFLGRFYDLPLQLLLLETLKPGDRFVDVGTNIGMITLLASKLVGTTGRVDSFEPNPECCRYVRQVVQDNAIGNVHLHPVGLNDTDGEATLTLVTEHSGMGTLASVPDKEREHITGTVAVRTAVGDVELDDGAGPIAMLKIDVEGFEMRVLRGLRKRIAQDKPVIVTEVEEAHLNRDGMSRSDLVELLTSLGYVPYSMRLRRAGLTHRLSLDPIADYKTAVVTDFVWLNHEGGPSKRLAGLLAGQS